MVEPYYFVTGSSGKLGRSLVPLLTNAHTPRHSDVDILQKNQLEQELAKSQANTIVHLAALSDAKYAQEHKDAAYKLNVHGTRNIAELALKFKIPLFYISTDYIFDGLDGNYREDSKTNPANWYGFTKLAGEHEVRAATKEYCIIRTSFRPSKWQFPTAFTNVFTSADYTEVIAAELATCLSLDLRGTIHIGTPKKSFYELAKRNNPCVLPEECTDYSFPKQRYLNIDKWLKIKQENKR